LATESEPASSVDRTDALSTTFELNSYMLYSLFSRNFFRYYRNCNSWLRRNSAKD